ncbi:putative DNA topoisomerase [Helianthus debilis subsp. tardiflorus]
MIFPTVDRHIMNLDFKMPFRDDWSRCKPIELFEKDIEKIEVKGKLNIINNLKQEAEQCQCLIRWLDCDREGESIADYVSEVCLKVNPDLHVYRALFSLLSDQEIKMAAKNLKKFNTSLSDVASMRREMDHRAGASFTRFQTLEVGNKFIFPSGWTRTTMFSSTVHACFRHWVLWLKGLRRHVKVGWLDVSIMLAIT